MLLFYPFLESLDPDFDTFTDDATDCLVRDLKSSPITCYFLFSLLSRIVLSHALYSAHCFRCIYECSTPVIIIFVDHNVWEYACFKLAHQRQKHPKICAAAFKVLHPQQLFSQNYRQHSWPSLP